MDKKKKEVITTTLRIRRDVYELAKEAATQTQTSFNSFAVTAIMKRASRWKDLLYGKPLIESKAERKERDRWADWVCYHGAHGPSGVPAAECPKKGQDNHRSEMVNERTGEMGFPPSEE